LKREADMNTRQGVSAMVVILATAITVPGFAQAPSIQDDILIPEKSQAPVAKSDHQRVVGKVLAIDHERGRVKLATDEGVVVTEAPDRTLRAIRVGETVSIPRSTSEQPSALPRQ
jgi:hypothetical protein